MDWLGTVAVAALVIGFHGGYYGYLRYVKRREKKAICEMSKAFEAYAKEINRLMNLRMDYSHLEMRPVYFNKEREMPKA